MIFKFIPNNLNLLSKLNHRNQKLKTILKHKKITVKKHKITKIKHFHHKYGNLKSHSKLGADNHHQILNLQRNKLINFFNLNLKITKINKIVKMGKFNNNKMLLQNKNKITKMHNMNNKKIILQNSQKLLRKLGINNKAIN